MRTLSTQVRLRRLVRGFSEAETRLCSEPRERARADSVVERLLELAGQVREAWEHENASMPLAPAVERYVEDSLRTAELAILGLRQAGADLGLLASDFERAALPLEVFMRGLDAEPALQRSA